MVAAVLVVAGPAGAAVRVVPDPWRHGGALGLLVPGHGATVTREQALRDLARQSGPAGTTVYVALPAGSSHNVRRYPVAVVGRGFTGLLTSPATRIPGLVSIRDLDGLGHRGDSDPRRTLDRLDTRLAQAHDARTGATLVVTLTTLALCGLALLRRSRRWAQAALLSIPAALGAALLLSALGGARPAVALPALCALIVVASLASARARGEQMLLGFLAVYLVVLTIWPEVNALAVVGPHPDGGGRFYGITNQVETLLLAPIVVAGTTLLWPAAAISLVLLGWSRAGADGGGLVVVAVLLGVLALRRRGIALGPRTLALVAVSALALGLALVGLDAAIGGSSHVTRAVGGGPLHLLGTLGHRLRISSDGVVSTWYHALIAGLSAAAVALFALLRPRRPALDALLVGLAVSLLVNDTATDVLGWGALSCAAVWTWDRLAER